jgi:hypothetical protein
MLHNTTSTMDASTPLIILYSELLTTFVCPTRPVPARDVGDVRWAWQWHERATDAKEKALLAAVIVNAYNVHVVGGGHEGDVKVAADAASIYRTLQIAKAATSASSSSQLVSADTEAAAAGSSSASAAVATPTKQHAAGARGIVSWPSILRRGGLQQYAASVAKPAAPLAEASVPKPAAAVPKPAAPVPKPAAAVPKPAAAVPKPAAAVPKPAAAVPTPAAAVPKGAAAGGSTPASNGASTIASPMPERAAKVAAIAPQRLVGRIVETQPGWQSNLIGNRRGVVRSFNPRSHLYDVELEGTGDVVTIAAVNFVVCPDAGPTAQPEASRNAQPEVREVLGKGKPKSAVLGKRRAAAFKGDAARQAKKRRT